MAKQNTRDGARQFGGLQVLGLVGGAVLLTAVATFLLLKVFLFPSEFKPVTLTPAEEKVLAEKLDRLDAPGAEATSTGGDKHGSARAPGLEPEPYNEAGLKREVVFSERELNGLLARNTDLADKLAIDLSDNLVSARLRLPVNEDFPILGGKVLRLRSGVEISLKNGRPVVILKGVTIMGIPVPNAWLGGMKNLDMVEKFGAEQGFWKTFSDGIEDIEVTEGRLKIKLKE